MGARRNSVDGRRKENKQKRGKRKGEQKGFDVVQEPGVKTRSHSYRR